MLDYKQDNYEHREIYDKIFVYSALLPDAPMLHEIMQSLYEKTDGQNIFSKWLDWYTLGKISSVDNEINFYDKYHFNALYEKVSDKSKLLKELYLFSRLKETTKKALNHYIKINNIDIPQNSHITSPGPAKYHPNVHNNNYGFTMNFHTDYTIGEWWWPGDKFLLTCTTYINDNYLGGEIIFYIDGDICEYKPQAGDILVFPSGNPLYPGGKPYYHGVKVIESGHKFLVRNYLKYSTNKNQEFWDQKEREHGKQEWYRIAAEEAKHKSTLLFEDAFENGQPRKQANYSDLVRQLYGL